MTIFDKIVNRRNTNSLKWDVAPNELPMWVADMDFATAPCITQALQKRAQSGVFGYEVVPDEWYQAYCDWWKLRHNWQIDKSSLVFVTGVVPALTSCVKSLTNVGDGVCVLTPVYDIFFHSVENTGRRVCECPLDYDGTTYSLDFDKLDSVLAQPDVKLLILCNPHNPIGFVWSAEQLQKIGQLCSRHGVWVFSDEIHCDLTLPGVDYVPFASVSEVCAMQSVTAISPSKAFNLAGLQSAAVVVPNEQLRRIVETHLNFDEIAEPSSFACVAAIAAFSGGGEWLDELRRYLCQNRRFLEQFVSQNIPQLKSVPQQATYLLWLDCSFFTHDAQQLCTHLRQSTGLFVSEGNKYRGNGSNFLRVNVACPRSLVEDGAHRLQRGLQSFSHSVTTLP